MIKIFFLGILLISVIYGYELNIKANSWHLFGTLKDIDLNSIGLKKGDIIWSYKNNKWYCFKKGYGISDKCEEINSLKAGDGFWLYSRFDNSLNLNEISFANDLTFGWNLISIKQDATPNNYFSNDIKFVWSYKDNKWAYYTPLDIDANISKINLLKKGDGVWVYKDTDEFVLVGDKKAPLINSEFNTTKNSSDDIENIWNIGFKINSSNLSDFAIGIKIVKTSTGARGEIIIEGLSINNGVLSKPSSIILFGEKSNGDSAQNSYDNSYDPDNLRDKVIELNGDILTIKIGTLVKNQDTISQSSFKAITTYSVAVNSDKPLFKYSKPISLGNITFNNEGDRFNNKNGIEGDIKIK